MIDKEPNPNLVADTRIYKELYKLGLSKKETAVYVASLQLGTSTIQNIATVSGVNRATTYVLIEALVKRGLIHSVTYDKKRFFTAEEPDKLDFFIHEDKIKLDKKEALIKSIIPKLDKIFDINKLENKTKVKFYDNVERGPDIIATDILKTTDENTLYTFYNYDLLPAELNFDFGKELVKKRIRRGIKTSSNFVSEQGNEVLSKNQKLIKDSKSIVNFIDNKDLLKDYKIFLASIGKKSIIVSLEGEFVGIIINSKPVASAVKDIINMMRDINNSTK